MLAYIREAQTWARKHPELAEEEDIRHWLEAYPVDELSHARGRPETQRAHEDPTHIRMEAAKEIAALNSRLRSRLEELQTIMDVAPVGIFVAHDVACTDITMNPAGATMLRLPQDSNPSMTGPASEVLAFKVLKDGVEIAPEDLPMQRAARTGQPVVGDEMQVAFPDGQILTLYEYALPLFDEAGGARGSLGIVIDITARKQAEEALRATEERYRAFIANSTEGIWRLEFDPAIDTTLPVEEQVELAYLHGRLAECNDVMARMYGFAHASEMIGMTLDPMLPGSDPATREYVASIIRAGYRVTDVDSVERDRAGNLVHFSNCMVGVVEDGWLKRIWGTQRDISKHKEADEALRESEARFRNTFENAAVGFAIVGLDGRWLKVNDRVCSITGYPREELLTKTFADITYAEDLEFDLAQARRLVTGELETYNVEKRYVRKDGSLVWINLTVSLQRDSTGAPRNFISVIEDINARKAAEEASRIARDEAEAASRAKDTFLATLSHELRTPLTPVLMAASALRDDESVPQDIREQLGMIQRNVALEARLIDDLLDLTRITRGKLSLRTERCDVHSLIELTADIVRDNAREKQIELSLELTAASHYLDADPARLQQVIWNLLRNAVKFTPDSGHIVIRSCNSTGAGGEPELCVTVTDNGIGFEPESAERIFEPFIQAGASRSVGLGLGLAIARAVVQLHDGVIRAESAGSGQGATFTVQLPHARDASCVTAASPVATGNGGPDSASPLRLLVVEDHEPTLQVLMRILSRAGHQILPARTVEQARAAARSNRIDFVISDLGLPDGTGTQLMDELRNTYGLRGIALSGYGMEDDLRRSEAVGFVAHLVKPVDANELKRVIRQYSG